MKILFLTIGDTGSIETRGTYFDILRYMRDMGHEIYVVTPLEKRLGLQTECRAENGVNMLRVRTGNITKCGMIEKGFSTLAISGQYKRAVLKYFKDIHFDLIMYSTPPITICNTVASIKRKTGAATYLLLKDIFPQNSIDIGTLSYSGPKGIISRYFRSSEKKLYAISDRIGCMSEANREYILKHNPEISRDKTEVSPNTMEIQNIAVTQEEKRTFRQKYGIPGDAVVFLYGGNLGKPQDVPFIVECLKTQKNRDDVFFLVVGSGADGYLLKNYVIESRQHNVKVLDILPRDEYEKMAFCCDVGLVFLDHRFTIPNFPSRILPYMQAGLPVLCSTDPNTDVGKLCEENGFGWSSLSSSPECFAQAVETVLGSDIKAMGKLGRQYLENNWTEKNSYEIIIGKDKER